MSGDPAEAIAALQAGDIGGLEVLVGLYERQAIRVAFQITANRQIAEDVVADAFLAVYDRIAQYDTKRAFTPWFYRIVVNTALKAVTRSEKMRNSLDIQLADQVDTSESPENEALRREEQVLVISAIKQLPAKLRATLTLRYYLEMDEATIASTLGVPRGTVKWRLHAARRQLRSTIRTMSARPQACTPGGLQ